jgi:hypothetical protein
MGTHWEQGKKTENRSPHPPHPFKKRKTGPVMEISLSKTVHHQKISLG